MESACALHMNHLFKVAFSELPHSKKQSYWWKAEVGKCLCTAQEAFVSVGWPSRSCSWKHTWSRSRRLGEHRLASACALHTKHLSGVASVLASGNNLNAGDVWSEGTCWRVRVPSGFALLLALVVSGTEPEQMK